MYTNTRHELRDRYIIAEANDGENFLWTEFDMRFRQNGTESVNPWDSLLD